MRSLDSLQCYDYLADVGSLSMEEVQLNLPGNCKWEAYLHTEYQII